MKLGEQFVPGGDFYSLIRRERSLVKHNTKFYAGQVILAIEFLHSKMIVFRDIKPENILVDERGYLKLADFGLAHQFIFTGQNALCPNRTFTYCGTPEYMAPEMILKWLRK